MAEGSSKGYPAGSEDGWESALVDPDVVEVPAEEAAGWSSSGRQKRKLTEVVPSDIIELDADDTPDGVMIIDEKIENHKNKQTAVRMDWPEHAKSDMSADNFTSSNTTPVTKVGPWNVLGGYHNNFSGSSAIPVTKVSPWDGLGGSHNNVTISNAIPITKGRPWDDLGGSHNVVIPNAISIAKVGPWDGLGGSQNNDVIQNAISITKVGQWDGLGGSHNNVTIPNAIPITKVGPWDGLGGSHNNVVIPNAIPITKFGPWDDLGGSHNNIDIPNAIPITKVGPWNGLEGSHNNVAIPNAIPITKVGPWNGLGGSHNNVTIPNAIPITKVGPWNGLEGSHNNVAIPNAIPITKVGPWNIVGGYHNNVSGPSAIPITKVGLCGGLGGYHNNVMGQGAIPITKVGPWNGLGGYHNSIAGSSAIPATNFSSWKGPMPTPYYYNHFVVAHGEKHKYVSNSTPLMESGSSFNSGANNHMEMPCVEAVLPQETSAEMPDQPRQTEIVISEVHEKYKTLQQFDTAMDHSDHFYALKVRAVKKPSKAWVNRLQHEWKVLENDLPDTIYVRVYEDRMDLLRAVIVGPAGTPYHDGLFFFDVYFPSRYPSKPPLVSYRSGGLRLNPNLYECGKVCLSLLNTWAGAECERWNPSNSTMLQVLVSIQALVLNAKPYFNEPGTMQYSLHNPPKDFEDFIVGHFCNYGSKILKGCKSYMAGAQVGCLVGDGVQDVDVGDKSCSTKFKATLTVLFADLMKEFAKIGVNCDEFQNPEAANATADTQLDLNL
ncbi:unnamed protein product [Urochloa humidicola]